MGERIARVTRPRNRALLPLPALLAVISCGGEDIQSPSTGRIEITTVTSGLELDADGYSIRIDQGTETAIAVNATMRRDDVEPGSHSVQLNGLAANCTVAGENPRTISMAGGETATVTFELSCSGTGGSLQITTTTTGGLPDPDGYTSALDDAGAQAIGTNATLTVYAVGPGAHRVTLGGLASNCRVVGENPRPVTVTIGATSTVAFSIACIPRIAFTRLRDGNSEIFVVNADGSGETRLTSGWNPAWSPDGSRIAFASSVDDNADIFDDNADIYVMNADGSDVRNLADVPADDVSPTWSPDGTKIAFDRTEFREGLWPFNAIMVMNADGTGVTQITDEAPYRYADPAWSRDGSRIAYTDWIYNEGDVHILSIRPDGTDLKDVTDPFGHSQNYSAAWSTGGKIAFESQPFTENDDEDPNWVQELPDIYIINADGTGLTRLTNNPANDIDPAWSRDDTKIAFGSDRRGNPGIYLMSPDGSEKTRLTEGQDSQPTWSP